MFFEIQQEESKKNVMNSRDVHADSGIDNSALVSCNADQGRDQVSSDQIGGNWASGGRKKNQVR